MTQQRYTKVKDKDAVRDSRSRAILFNNPARYSQAKKRKKMLDKMAKQEAELTKLKSERSSILKRLEMIEQKLQEN